MAKRARVQTDGITTTTTETFDARRPMSKADAAALIAALQRTVTNASFELKIRALDAYLHTQRGRSKAPIYGSRAYYARAILDTIAAVRQLRDMGSPGGTDAALAAAMRVGWLAAEWEAKGWPDLQLGLAWRRQQRENAAKGAQAKRDTRARRDAPLRQTVTRYRHAHPSMSARAIASALVGQYGSRYNTIPDRTKAIDALRKRIERLNLEEK
jgi:hypothetical protein